MIYEVWRGREILSMDNRLLDLGGMISLSGNETGNEIATNLVHSLQLHSTYNASDCINSFHPSQKIGLVGCGFFGPLPHKYINHAGGQKSVEYKVTLRLEMVWKSRGKQSDNQKTRTLAEVKREGTVDLFRGQSGTFSIFYVDFDNPIELDPDAIKYNLIFRLEGPNSFELDPTKLNRHAEAGGVNFSFWPGSKQMPILKFIKP